MPKLRQCFPILNDRFLHTCTCTVCVSMHLHVHVHKLPATSLLTLERQRSSGYSGKYCPTHLRSSAQDSGIVGQAGIHCDSATDHHGATCSRAHTEACITAVSVALAINLPGNGDIRSRSNTGEGGWLSHVTTAILDLFHDLHRLYVRIEAAR